MYLRPETFNILGGGQTAENQTDRRSEHQGHSGPEPSRREKFKIKVKNAWRAFVEVAQDIKDTIVPIITAIGTLLAGLAAFHNRNQHRGRTAWAS